VNGRIPSSPTINILGSGFQFPKGSRRGRRRKRLCGRLWTQRGQRDTCSQWKHPASPTILTLSTSFSYPWGIAVDSNGNIYVTEPYSNAVEEILAVDGSIPTSPTTVSIVVASTFQSELR